MTCSIASGRAGMKRAPSLFGLLACAAMASAAADQPPQAPSALLNEVRAACQADAQKLCPGVQTGGGRILSCLAQHRDAVSDACTQAVMKARQAQGQGPATPSSASQPTSAAQPAGATAPSAPAAATHSASTTQLGAAAARSASTARPAPAAQPASATQPTTPAARPASTSQPAAPAAHSTSSSASTTQPSSEPYFRMKRVQLADDGMNKMPAVDIMIPTTWQLQSSIGTMRGAGGCFADLETISIRAQSADGSLVFEVTPNFTWQYADDPGTVRTMTQEGQAFAKGGIKPCPVMPPQRAADFLRKNIIAKSHADKRVVSVDPYPDFELLLRQQQRLPLNDTSHQGPVRTDAARARLEFDRDGKTFEEWVTVAEWMRLYPAGRGNVYDCHATMLMTFTAPKGQLDRNEKLFKLMAFNITHEPKWEAQVNGMVAQLYRQQQIEEAKRSQIIAQLQQHVADTINEVTANAQRGSNQSAFGADQGIRGVQTFRNPQTGDTFELSNLHDHAWLNGSGNEYLMSDDPNFNPNGRLNGNWRSLEPVQAQP